MKPLNQTQVILISFLGFICWLIPSSIYGLWIYASGLGTNQAERVKIFRGYFPEFLSGQWGTTLLSVALCALAVLCSLIAIANSKTLLRVLNFMIMILSGLLLALNLWSML